MTRLYQQYQGRIRFVAFSFLFINLGILGKLFFIQSIKSSEYGWTAIREGRIELSVNGRRGTIYDRDGGVLAETIHKYTFWANTVEQFDKDEIIHLFTREFNRPEDHYRRILSQQKRYIVLEKDVLRGQCQKILKNISHIKGLHSDVSVRRYYPNNNLASQVLGYVDVDHIGQFGIESQFDVILRGKTTRKLFDQSANGTIREALQNGKEIINGNDIQLTIDSELQTVLITALLEGLNRSGAKSANGIILNPFTGEILAMASAPDFNPNHYSNHEISTFKNRVLSDAYEPGSTFKIVALTAALESGIINPEDTFFCENGEYPLTPLKIIHDHEPHEFLTVAEMFIYSSNIGLTKLTYIIGSESIYEYARKFSFGIRTGIPLPSEVPGVLRDYQDWTRFSGPMVSMGQEISATTLQLGLAFSAAANGGYLPSPKIIQKISGDEFANRKYDPLPIRRVMSKHTAKLLLEMMEEVVLTGTGTKARIPGYRIGGKTGTGEKFINGKYSKREFISSFAAVFPIDNPLYVCVVSVDSPKYGLHWGNETAAPIVKEIFERIIIMNDDIKPVKQKEIPQFASVHSNSFHSELLSTRNVLLDKDPLVPNFLGKTLKQAILEAKYIGLPLSPVGTSGRVVWQSVKPGNIVQSGTTCKIKLESL